ncbi:metal tolerance protein 3-like [Lolium perenne]|uniref:metal tolerance protein 3-like n=1 Tax=Lolium perenne TaxID=4522 RepID=UPI003A98FF40
MEVRIIALQVVLTLFYSSSLRVVSGATGAFFVTLVGQSAPPEMLQMLTYLAMKHDANMQRVDTVRAYSFGALYFVEVLCWLSKGTARGWEEQEIWEKMPVIS